MKIPVSIALSLLAAALAAAAAVAQELLPPLPGLTVTYRFTKADGSAGQPDHTYRVVSVDGVRSKAELTRADAPKFRGSLDSYRVWYSVRTVQITGTLHQDTPTAMIEELAPLAVGTIRVFPAKLRFEPALRADQSNGAAPKPVNFDVTMTYAIEARERVTVPAGTFDAFVLRRTQEIPGPDGRVGRRDTTRTWYAPDLRWWVKLETKSELPEQPAMTGVAIEIKRP